MKKKGMQKRVLAALLAGIMCVGSVQVFPGMVDEVKASGETLAPDERVETTTLFESNFDNVTETQGQRGALVTAEGWTAYSDCDYGISTGDNPNPVTANGSNLKVKSSKKLNFYSEYSDYDKDETGESSVMLIKHIEGAADYDKVIVVFDLELEAAVKNEDFYFYVGEVFEDNVWSRKLRDTVTDDEDTAYMSQVYWSHNVVKANENFANKVTLEFDILGNDVAEVTTYIGDSRNPDGETKTISLDNGMLNLAFAARVFKQGSNKWDEGYLDNVKVTGERVVRTVETTLFESNFDNASITNANVIGDTKVEKYIGSLVEEEGWSAYGDRHYGISEGGTPVTPKYINIRVKDDGDYTGDKNINIWATGNASNASLIKHVKGASSFDQVTVEFDLQLFADNGDSNFYFYVGEVAEDNVWSRYLEDASQSDTAYMSQVYWSKHPTERNDNFEGKVKLVFDILNDDVAEVTTYVGDSTNPDGEAKYIALHDGMLNLAFVTRVSKHSSKERYDEAYLDDVKVTGTKDVRRKAEVETAKKLLFHSDLESTLGNNTIEGNTGYLTTREGWDGEPKNLWPHKLADIDGNDTLKINMYNNSNTSQVGGIYKSVDVKTADKVTVDFELNMMGDSTVSDLKFAVGSLLKGNNFNYIEQEYWSCDSSDEFIKKGWNKVHLELDMITNSLAIVTAKVNDAENGEPKLIVIPDGKLQLGFVANGLTNNNGWNEVYMDNVWVYAEEPITTESVLANGGEYTLFQSDFTTSSTSYKNLTKEAGWDDSRRKTGMHVRQSKELNMYIGEEGEEVQGVFKRVYTKDADKVIVEFKLRMDADAGSDNFKFTVGAPQYNDLQKSIEHEYWSCDKSDSTGDSFTDVKLVFEMLSDTTAKVTAYVGETQDGEAKVVTVQKGLFMLAFVGNVTHNGTTSDEIYMDDVVVTGINEKHATTVVTETLFDADFETSVSNNGASSLKSEGWDKGSYKFDNDGDGQYDVFPNTHVLEGSGTSGTVNSKLNINTDAKGNKALMFKSDGGSATSRIQKVIDVTNLDNFVVEFEYQTSGDVKDGYGWYGEFQLVQDPDYVWVYDDTVAPTLNEDGTYKVPGEVPQFERPIKGYDAVFNATSEGKMAKARVEFNVETKTVHAYTWNDATESWEVLEGYESTGMQTKNNKVYLTFMYSALKGGYAYLDNVNIYATKEAEDGRIIDVNGNKTLAAPAMLDGASIRFEEPAGIRFKGYVNKEYIKTLKYLYGDANVKYGVVIAPYDLVSDEFTIAKLGQGNYLKIEGAKIAAETDKYYQFNCAMVNVSEANWGRDFAARTYIEIKKADGTTEYVYSDFDSKDNVRSLADVATRALAAGGYSGTKKEQLEKYSVVAEPLSVGSDLRVMSMNILSEEAVDGNSGYEEVLDVKNRAPILKSTIEKYNPTVVGIQEYTSRWSQYLSLDAKYKVIDGKETAIIYDSTMLTVVDSGHFAFEKNKIEGDHVSDHTTTWAAMQTKSGEKFLFVNTHLDYFSDGGDTEGVVESQLNQVLNFISEKKATYQDYALILVGDFNNGYSSDEYKAIVATGLLDGQDAVLSGLSQGGFTCDTIPGRGKHEEDLYGAHGGDSAFDHIFIDTTTPVKFKKFSVVVDDEVINLTDHYPLYADIVLNPEQ